MRREEAIALLKPRIAELRAPGVGHLSLFGSTARDDARSDSDVDVVVDFDGGATLDRYLDLKERLEAILGTRVDLVTTKGLKPRLRAIVAAEAVQIT
jgi:predicted nucleotidyltransferase